MNIGDLQNAENNTDGIHSALPTELHSKFRAAGFEPVASALSGRCATTAPLLEKNMGEPF